MFSTKSKRSYTPQAAEDQYFEAVDTSLPPVIRVDAASLMRVSRQLEVIAKRQAPRIACKAKGRILFLDLSEIVAVQAEGNYVSLQHRPNPYLLRESLSSIAEKLKPYGFIRIHRSVVVNISAVEEIQPLPTGEYRLRVKGEKNYLVTRPYKDNLRDLAQQRYSASLTWPQRKVLDAIARCRTAALGGHRDACVSCGHQAISYNSCRNRHCPKCQTGARDQWLAKRQLELLAVGYYHLVFSVPHMLVRRVHATP